MRLVYSCRAKWLRHRAAHENTKPLVGVLTHVSPCGLPRDELRSNSFFVVPGAGFEPATFGFWRLSAITRSVGLSHDPLLPMAM